MIWLSSAVTLGAFIRYILSAGAATVLDVAMVQTLLATGWSRTALGYAGAMALGALAGTAVNFLGARHFVFAVDSRAPLHQLSSYCVIAATTLLLRLAVAFALVALLGNPLFEWMSGLPMSAPQERLAHLGAVVLVMFYSFFAHKHVTFAGGVLAFLTNKAAVRPCMSKP